METRPVGKKFGTLNSPNHSAYGEKGRINQS
jgi:hypothetical protein